MNNKFIEIYIHIPFCEKKCNYCDFVSFTSNNFNINKYIKVMKSEIINKAPFFSDYTVSTIYIGGGTPSSINAIFIKDILYTVYNNFNISNNCEISIEINPHSCIESNLKIYYESGINRLSFGVQSANDDELVTLGRIHTFNDFLKSYDDAIHIGFKNISADIMYGIPNQTPESYKKTLKQIMKLNLKHLSIYSLIIEEGTNFYELQKQNKLSLPSEDIMTELDNITEELTTYYRYNKYEISNYAKEGFICLHNLGYWSDISYIGFGLNASSYIDNVRYKNFSNFKKYLNTNFNKFNISNETYYEEVKHLSFNELMSEYVFLGMRKINGISSKDFYNKFNKRFEDVFPNQIDNYLAKNLICYSNGRYFFSKLGMDISNTILADFIL